MKWLSKLKKIMQKKIYIYRIGSLGDSIVALPTIKKIQERYKQSSLVLVTEKSTSSPINSWSVLRLANIFDDVIFYNKSLKSIFNLVLTIRKENHATLFYLAPYRPKLNLLRDWIFFRILCGINNLNGFGSSVEPESYKDKEGNLPFQVKEYLQLLKVISDNSNENEFKRPILRPSNDDLFKAKKLLSSLPLNSIILALAPGSKMSSKKWPIKNYSQLVNKILSLDKNFSIAILGGQQDVEEADFILNQNESSRLISLAGKTSIAESAAVMSLTSMYIGNDTGTMHLASAMGINCLGIFASRANPGRWEPFGNNNIILRKELDCSGCDLEVCDKNNQCLRDISVEEVFNAFIKLNLK